MPNGKPGDHPLPDITIHNQRVYSERADGLIREIVRLGGRREIENMLFLDYNTWDNPDVPKLEGVLTAIYERLIANSTPRAD
jgi:hypothetical protein